MSQAAPIKKTDNLLVPTGENYLSWGDFNTLNWKLNGAMATMLVWFILQAWESYKKSKDDTKERLERIEKSLERLTARLEHTPTFKDLHEREQ
jgi:hypothetical protein